MLLIVMAVRALAPDTEHIGREAFTIQLQALGALAPALLVWPWFL
jgi:hypothetical protein